MTQENKTTLAKGLALAGNISGIVIAVKRKSGFWGGVGWFIVGGLAGAAIGLIAGAMIPDKKVIVVTAPAAADESELPK